MSKDHIAIVGAGLVGGVQACYLAQRGYKVSVFDRRPDIREVEFVAGKSINLALSDRGWKALEGVGVAEEVKTMAIPMPGRMMHDVQGELTFQPYGKEGQYINSVSRGGLNQVLLRKAATYDNVDLYFDEKCLDVKLDDGVVVFENTVTGKVSERKFDRIFGTDGVFSAVRTRMHRLDRFNYEQKYLTHAYKEQVIHPNPDGTHKMEKNALHIWPREEFMLIALPNMDGSYTVTLFMPFEGPVSFEALGTDEEVTAFFRKTFPDALDLMPTLIEDYHENPTSSMCTVRCYPWHYKDKVCLIGDSAHAIVPFYGQGMNAGFEDCTVFDDLLNEHGENWVKLFELYSEKRKPAGDAILELALRNYIVMRDLTADPEFLLQKKIENRFSEKYPDKWIPLYEQVTFTHIPYHEALAAGDVQDAIMKRVMDRPDIEQVWDSDEIEEAILKELRK
jgi:kynurenine 3-monooxygenase